MRLGGRADTVAFAEVGGVELFLLGHH
jgi:hypothetical protein